MAKASDNQFPYLHLVPAAAPASPGSGSQRLYLDSADGNKLKRKDATGTVTTIEGGGSSSGGGAKSARAQRTSGNITGFNSTTFANVDTGLDLVIAAVAGDVLEVELNARASKSTSGSTYLVFDFHTIVGGSPVNSVTSGSAAGTGLASALPGWGSGTLGDNTQRSIFTGTKQYVVQAGDISGGNVTLRLRAFCGASVLIDALDPRLYVAVKNLQQ